MPDSPENPGHLFFKICSDSLVLVLLWVSLFRKTLLKNSVRRYVWFDRGIEPERVEVVCTSEVLVPIAPLLTSPQLAPVISGIFRYKEIQ